MTWTPQQRAQFFQTGQLPSPWSDQLLTAGVTTAFTVAAVLAGLAALVALFVIQVRASDLERLQGAARAVPAPAAPSQKKE